MKKVYTIFVLLLIAFPFASFAGPHKKPKRIIVSPDSTECYAGKQATVCGKIYGYYYNPRISGHPTFLDMGGVYPNSKFTVLIGDSALVRFNYDVVELVDNDVCVTGMVTVYNDKPEMIIADPIQIVPAQRLMATR